MRIRSRRIVLRSLPGRTGGLLAVVAGLLSLPAPAAAQFMDVAVASSPSDGEPKPARGFSIPTDESLQTKFSDFERFAERKVWEKAFAVLNEIPADKRTGMLARPDGVYIPAEQRMWESLAALPADGREAFRVFHDAKARQTWAPVAEGKASPAEASQIARSIFNDYFLTTVGDNAANLLGDAAFEQGDFAAAERCWRSVLDAHPDSDIPEPRLLLKRGLALVQLDRLTEAEAVRKSLEQRHAGKSTRLGGRDVEPAAVLAGLLRMSRERSSTGSATAAAAVRGAPPANAPPLWRTQFLSNQGFAQIQANVRQNYWYRNGMETQVPAVATDGARVYCNWFGLCFAVDAASGKLLWRSQKFGDLTQQFPNMPHSPTNLEAYSIVAGGDVVVACALPLDRINYWQEPFRLIAYDAATGNVKWKTLDDSALSNVDFVGRPLFDDGQIYALGVNRGEAQVTLYILEPATGKVASSKPLGNTVKRQTPRGYEVVPQPVMLKRGPMLYIATEAGALTAYDLSSQSVRWMISYDTPEAGQSSNRVYYGGVDLATQLHTRTALLEHAGLLYVKELGSRELVAIDPSGPRLVWKRPAEKHAQLVAVDDDALYLLDTELSAIDRRSHKLLWATRLPITVGGLSVLVGPDVVLTHTSRGVYELDRKSGGILRIFRGLDLAAGGGGLRLVGDQLVCVSMMAVTNYGDPGAGTTPASPAGPRPSSETPEKPGGS